MSMSEDSSLQDSEVKTLVQSHKAELEQKMSELSEFQATLPSLQEQLSIKQAALNNLQSQCCHDNVIGLLADVREMKEKIKETKNDQDHVDIEITKTMCGEVSTDLLSQVSALREKIKEKEILLQQLSNRLSEGGVKPFMNTHQVKLYWYKQLYNFVDKFLHGNV